MSQVKRSKERCDACGLPMFWVDGELWCLDDNCPSTKTIRDAHAFNESLALAVRWTLGFLVLLFKVAVIYVVWKTLTE